MSQNYRSLQEISFLSKEIGCAKNMLEKKGISVVICCYNSADRLPQTLKHLALQMVAEDVLWEIILIDNNSTDNTSLVAQQEWKRYSSKIPFIILEESRPGLAYAREKGVLESKYSYLLFCDDDNWLNEDYLQRAFEIMENDQEIGMLGGEGIAISDDVLPEWFYSLQGMFAIGPQNAKVGDITSEKGYVYGACCVLRLKYWKNILDKNVKLLLTDRKGEQTTGGGDNEIGYLLSAAGYKIFWSPNLVFKHYIPKSRLSVDYIRKLRRGFATNYEMLKVYKYKLKLIPKGRLKNSVIGDLLDSSRIMMTLWLKLKIGRITKIQFILHYYFHGRRIVEIVKNGAGYPEIHHLIENNINQARSCVSIQHPDKVDNNNSSLYIRK